MQSSSPLSFLLSPLALLAMLVSHVEGAGDDNYNMTLRHFDFDVRPAYAPFVKALSNITSIYHQWPPKNLRTDLPEYLQIASIHQPQQDEPTLMGPAVHVQQGDRLNVALRNSLMFSGLSIHWHGFEMKNGPEYDGVVGVTQCAVSPSEHFLYNFTVEETPGTYWYHTHSGALGIDAYDAVRGPLIVHPPGEQSKTLVDQLNEETAERGKLAYANERILLFSDGILMSEAKHDIAQLGGLNAPVSKNDDGFVVGITTWEFGTCNGRLREIVRVVAGKTYKLRLINAGHLFALRIDLGIKMTVVAADSEPVVPFEVDQVILHTAERFDVEITIPPNAKLGETFWVKADTLESTAQGYQNGIRAILQIVDPESPDDIHDEDVQDPRAPIYTLTPFENLVTLNCYSQNEVKNAGSDGGCLPITALQSKPAQAATEDNPSPEVHTVDFAFFASPQHSHFVRIDNSPFLLQHTNPQGSILHPSFDPSTDMHPHSAVLHVAAYSSAIIIWRSSTLVDHPIHLHGLKMEILDVFVPERHKSCSLAYCELSDDFNSPEQLKTLVNKSSNQTVLKDTFILPAGGAVAVRIQTGAPNVWFAHCHLNSHKEDGMALILNVGKYRAPSNGIWLPEDYPDCETPFLKSQRPHPACECYVNKDAVLGTALTANHRCSRDHLCHHELGQVAHLQHYMYPGGVAIRSQYMIPEWGVSLLMLLSIAVITMLVHCISRAARSKATPPVDEGDSWFSFGRRATTASSDQEEHNDGSGIVEAAVASNTCEPDGRDTPDEENGSGVNGDYLFWEQLQHIFQLQWELYRPTCVNLLRVFEVTGLALLTGILFYDVGNDVTANGLAQKTSLLFYGVTLWTFTRMYPSVASYFLWTKNNRVILSHGRFDVLPVCLGRLLVVVSAEWFWPFLYCFVCFPMAGIAGDVKVVFEIGALLALNNLCYISIGAVIGTVFTSVPLGMIASTIISQTSLVAAGFYTTLPPIIEYIRYVSPVFWTFKGILKASYHRSDTYKCFKGQSDVGVNQCFLEFNPGIDTLKTRGIDVSSDKTFVEFLVLIFLFSGMQLFIIARTYAHAGALDETSSHPVRSDTQHAVVALDETSSHLVRSDTQYTVALDNTSSHNASFDTS